MKFKEYLMEDALDAIIDYRGKTPQKSDTGIPTLSAKSVKNNHINYAECYYISEAEYKRFMVRGFPQKGDILLTTEAPMGMVAKLDRDDVAIAQRLLTLRGKEGVLDNDYLLYLLQSPYGQGLLKERETGTTVTGIKQAEFRRIIVKLPDITIQKKIGSILSAIDHKIACNTKINDNLQQQLATIYKSWYQDYSRVADKEFVETEHGLIPEGWHYSLLGYLCQSISITHKFDKEELIFLNTGDVEDGRFLHSDYMAIKEMPGQAKKTIAPGDILYSEIRPINRHFAFVNFPSSDYVVSTKLMVIRARSFDSIRLYHYLTSDNVLAELQLQAESRSGTFPQIRFDNVSRLPILIADEQTENDFVDLLHTVYAQIEHINTENERLADLRDNLLPKLMSGEIDVSAIQI